MYAWTEVYEDEYIKERIEELNQAQQTARQQGKLLVSSYEQFWLPNLNDLPEVEYVRSQLHRAPYGTFEPARDALFYGALWFTPVTGAELPAALKKDQDWLAASASVDMNARTVKIQINDIEITFTGLNVSQGAHELLREVNQELVRARAGVYVYRLEPLVQDSAVRHLYPNGRIPTLSNAHTRADVTGFAVLQDRPYQHTLAYVGIAAHKTSVESLWASLIRGRGGCSLRGASILADGEIKMVTQALVDFNLLHAGLICRKALPGKWEAKDDAAYALIFEDEEETDLQVVTLKRLQETLAFPIPDTWAKTLWEYALDAEFIQRLETGGDCLGGVRIDLTRDWQALVQNLLEQDILKV